VRSVLRDGGDLGVDIVGPRRAGGIVAASAAWPPASGSANAVRSGHHPDRGDGVGGGQQSRFRHGEASRLAGVLTFPRITCHQGAKLRQNPWSE